MVHVMGCQSAFLYTGFECKSCDYTLYMQVCQQKLLSPPKRYDIGGPNSELDVKCIIRWWGKRGGPIFNPIIVAHAGTT